MGAWRWGGWLVWWGGQEQCHACTWWGAIAWKVAVQVNAVVRLFFVVLTEDLSSGWVSPVQVNTVIKLFFVTLTEDLGSGRVSCTGQHHFNAVLCQFNGRLKEWLILSCTGQHSYNAVLCYFNWRLIVYLCEQLSMMLLWHQNKVVKWPILWTGIPDYCYGALYWCWSSSVILILGMVCSILRICVAVRFMYILTISLPCLPHHHSENNKSAKLSHFFFLRCAWMLERISTRMSSTDSRFVLGPSNILFPGSYVCNF